MKKVTRALRAAALFLLMCGVALVALEGISSTVLYGLDFLGSFRETGLHSRRNYLEPDTLIGWKKIRDLDLEDLYGPGRGVHSNRRGFRGTDTYTDNPPGGTTRIICSGNSFTFGIGVGDDDTWCAMLGALRDDWEAINLGESGYGIDQVQLRYQRDAARIGHHVHVVAVIDDSFRRAQLRTFSGYQRPYYVIRDGSLQLENVPVGRSSVLRTWWVANNRRLTDLRTLEFFQRGFGLRPGGILDRANPGEPEILVELILESIAASTAARNAQLVILFLAQAPREPETNEDWRQFLRGFAAERNLLLIDAADRFENMPFAERRSMFKPAWGHYSEEGNRVVAEIVAEALADGARK